MSLVMMRLLCGMATFGVGSMQQIRKKKHKAIVHLYYTHYIYEKS